MVAQLVVVLACFLFGHNSSEYVISTVYPFFGKTYVNWI